MTTIGGSMKQLTKKGIIELIILSLFIVVCFPFLFIDSGQSHTADAESWTDHYIMPSGAGTAADPFRVSSAEELAAFVYGTKLHVPFVNIYIQLTENIDLGGKLWPGIGSEETPFKGNFDGQGHQIYNLDSEFGLFGFVESPDPNKNITIKDVWVSGEVNGNYLTAGIVASAQGVVTISGCVNMCHVSNTLTDGYAAGIVGTAYGTNLNNGVVIENCTNYGVIEHYSGNVGGIAGGIYQTSILNCVNNGELYGETAAGIVNIAQNVFGITNCYNADVFIDAASGAGIVLKGQGVYYLECCFDLKTMQDAIGEYYPITSMLPENDNANYKAMDGPGIGMFNEYLIDEAMSPDWYEDTGVWDAMYGTKWNIETIWYADGLIYPILQHKLCITLDKAGGTGGTNFIAVTLGQLNYFTSISIPSKEGTAFNGYFTRSDGEGSKVYDFNGTSVWKGTVLVEYIDKFYASWGISQSKLWSTYSTKPAGAGTADSPYLVHTPNELAYFAFVSRTSSLNAVIHLEANIDLDGYYWEPIGNNFAFTGLFDGQGYIIKNIQVDTAKNAGLFGKVTDATIANVYLQTGLIVGRQNLGSIVGYANNTQVINCYNTARINGLDFAAENVGGIVGYAINGGKIEGCYNLGIVGGAAYIGGVLGRHLGNSNTQFLIKTCYVQGGVDIKSNAVHDIGGIVGSVDTSGTFELVQSFAHAAFLLISSKSVQLTTIGGLVGKTTSAGTKKIVDCGYYGNILLPSGVSAVAHNSMYGTFSGTITDSFGKNMTGASVMVGTSFSNWGYSEYLNNGSGIPLQKCFSYALAQGNQDVYAHLVSKGFVAL